MSKEKKKSRPPSDLSEVTLEHVPKASSRSGMFSFQSHIQAISICIFLILLIQLIVFKDYIFLKKLYLFLDIGSDSYNLFYPAYVDFARYLRAEGFPTWSFSSGMGASIFPGGLNCPFNWFLYIIEPEYLAYGIIFIELLKMVLSGVIVYLYLSIMDFSKYTSVVGGVLAAFVGYMVLGSSGWYGHSTFVVYFFLLLYAFELFYRKNNPVLFPLAVFFVASDPFKLYMFSVFLFTYVLFRLFSDNRLSARESVMFLMKLAGLGAIGVGMSAFFLLDEFLGKINSPRVTGSVNKADLLQSFPVLGLPGRLETATILLRFFSNDLLGVGSEFKGFANYLEAPIFYSGLVSLILAPQAVFIDDKRKRIAFGAFFIVWMLPLIFPFFRYALYAFMGNYYKHGLSMFIPAIMLLYGLNGLEKIQQNNRLSYGVLLATLAMLLIILHLPYFDGTSYADKNMIDQSLKTLISCFLIIDAGILCLMRMDSARVYAKAVFVFLVCVEAGWFSWITVNQRTVLTQEQFKGRIGYNDYTIDAVDYVESIDGEFFRINKDYSSSLAETKSINDAKIYGYFGTPSYSSFNRNEYIDFLYLTEIIPKGQETKTRWAIGLLQRPFLQAVASVKYNLLKSEDFAQRDVFFKMVYENIATFEDVTVLKNNFFLPLGFTYDQYMLRKDYESLSRTHKDMAMFCAVVMDHPIESLRYVDASEMAMILKNYKLSDFYRIVGQKRAQAIRIEQFSQKRITGEISIDAPQMLFFSIPIDSGWQAFVNGSPAPLVKANIGFMGISLNPGDYKVELKYRVSHLNATLPVSILFLIIYLAVVLRKRIFTLLPFNLLQHRS